MSGIYLHIPFCKQACHYCDFHFSTSLKKKDDMLSALLSEIAMRKAEAGTGPIETIYFGGGTPSVLSTSEIRRLLDAIYSHYSVAHTPEITLEANPDDLSDGKLAEWAATPVNRLSIGIQSFFDEDLRLMNRAHDAESAKRVLAEAVSYFDNISVDLIYGIPGMDDDKWLTNVETVVASGVPHISSYALTVEPRTALKKMIATGQVNTPSDEAANRHFHLLSDRLAEAGFLHYELSNFGKPGYFSRNNSAYWLGKNYIGIGPSAHSYDGVSRSWNVANNALYIKGIQGLVRPAETEVLTPADRFNEAVMTGLRTMWGISLSKVERDYGADFHRYLLASADRFIEEGLLLVDGDALKTTQKGKFLADGLASDLFYVG
ncbi:MAG TPA: radical SAM family heme chaperone HemW [Flavobacterium sp.]|nr:radical SAM family heme chaperone HemW [Flavobacterium sp.]